MSTQDPNLSVVFGRTMNLAASPGSSTLDGNIWLNKAAASNPPLAAGLAVPDVFFVNARKRKRLIFDESASEATDANKVTALLYEHEGGNRVILTNHS